jgi:alpha,alpha-trehalase
VAELSAFRPPSVFGRLLGPDARHWSITPRGDWTTSLPEGVGGERNWDYRYAWVRDASFTMQALWVAACPDEASNFFEFMTTAAASAVGPLMFSVGGEHDVTERELHHLPGWKDSRPVRVGNAAWNQRQIDVYGELLDAAVQLSEHIDAIDEDTRRFLIACAEAAASSWTEKDRGIWEVRGDPSTLCIPRSCAG